jgi:carbon-monoxide dehydrogenase medium subunit
MRTFALEQPGTVAEAVALLRRESGAARPLAGGTALVPLWKQGVVSPTVLVDVSRIRDLARRSIADGAVTVGAMVRLAEIEDWSALREAAPLLYQACRETANRRIREMATIGGGLAHGEAASDMNTAALACDLRVHLAGPDSVRTVTIDRFFTGLYETAVTADEIVTHVSCAVFSPRRRHAYVKFSPRSRYDKPALAVAVAFSVGDDGACADVRIALGGIEERPLRVPDAERTLERRIASADVIDETAAAAERVVKPIDDLRGSSDYKRAMVRVFVRRALRQAHATPSA